MATFFILKDPSDQLDYTINYASFLDPGDSIATSSWTCVDAIVTIFSSSTTSNSATAWVKGGTASQTSTITNIMTSANNPARIVYRRIELTLMQR